MRTFRFLFLAALLFLNTSFQYIYQKISLEMETRSVAEGKSSRVRAVIYYTAEGKMVSYFSEPQELVIVNNKKGDLTIYNPVSNTVSQQQNYMFGTETNQLYFFLENKRNDLGLSAMGYTATNTRFEEGLKITDWLAPMNLAAQISKVQLVHEKGNPIFMAYHNANGSVIKKMYFYKYSQVSEYISLPSTITQIDFKTAADSIITKTTYSGFRLNQTVSDEKLNFVVPANAKVLAK